MRVVVVGAGISGLALAVNLQRAGHDVVVLEEAEHLRTGGASVAIWHNGATALRRLGIEFGSHGRVIEQLEFWSTRGRRIGSVNSARLSSRFGIEPVTIPRGELIELLFEGLSGGSVRFGTSCRRVEEGPRHATVETDDASLQADLVVGADGHRSVVRHQFAPDLPARPTGWASLQGLTPAPSPLVDGTTSIYSAGRAGAVGLMPAGRGLLQWWFDVPWPPAEAPNSIVQWLRSRFAPWEGPVRDLLAVITDDEVEPFPHAWHPIPPTLCSDHVVLICDAVHAVPPVLAQGANQSIEDAWVLVRELEANATIPEALAAYQAERRRKVSIVSRAARGPALPVYGMFGMMPRQISWLTEAFCTWAWRMVQQSCSSTIPLVRKSR